MNSAQLRIYGEWAVAEASDAVRSTFGRGSPTQQKSPSSNSQVEGSDGLSPEGQAADEAIPSGLNPSEERAQIRRAQVRRAQLKHRQRKANHVKELELDASELREKIAQTEAESNFLNQENELIKAKLRELGIPFVLTQADTPRPMENPAASDQSLPHIYPTHSESSSKKSPQMNFSPASTHAQMHQHQFSPEMPSYVAAGNTPELFGDIDINDLSVSLGVDENLGSPRFHVSPREESPGSRPAPSGALYNGILPMTLGQEHMAINFILSLEYGCWSHFGRGDFHNHEQESSREKGHTLMASSYCMATAPDSVYDKKWAFYNPLQKNPELEWTTNGLTLQNLYRLAQTLNPSDLEVAPVQAWFELADRYPPEMLLQQNVLDTLAREFRGTVHCVIYGAAVERQAFESIVYRVLGPPPAALAECSTAQQQL